MTLATNYAQNARSFAIAAERLVESDEVGPGLHPAFYFLIGFALELGFKSLALAEGEAEETTISWGHDLKKGFIWAQRRGFVPDQVSDLEVAVYSLADHHKNLTLRYTKADQHIVQVPPPTLSLAAAKALAQHAERAAWSSFGGSITGA